jgi:hypothetical protein
MERIKAVKQRISELHQELEKLHKELADLHASLPKVPEPPIVIQPIPVDVEREQLIQAINKWSTLLKDANASEQERKRASDEISKLKHSLAKLDMTKPELPKPPLPCLGAYIDASGQLRNACDDKNVKPLPGPKDDVACMALNCPKPAQPVKPVQPPVKQPPAQPVKPLQPPVKQPPAQPVKPVQPPVKQPPAQPVKPVQPPVKKLPIQPVKPQPPVKKLPIQPVKPQPVKPELKTQTVKSPATNTKK